MVSKEGSPRGSPTTQMYVYKPPHIVQHDDIQSVATVTRDITPIQIAQIQSINNRLQKYGFVGTPMPGTPRLVREIGFYGREAYINYLRTYDIIPRPGSSYKNEDNYVRGIEILLQRVLPNFEIRKINDLLTDIKDNIRIQKKKLSGVVFL